MCCGPATLKHLPACPKAVRMAPKNETTGKA